MNKILVIGAGAMGAAFTFPLVDNNHNVTLTEPYDNCLLYTSPSPRDAHKSRMPSSA